MTTTTRTVWGIEAPTLEQREQLHAQAAAMAAAGKTDGVYTLEDHTPTLIQHTAVRTWTTVADAQEWITFVSQFNPDSNEII